MTIIYTDGSSRGNPGRGGWGTIVISDDKVIELGGRQEMTTNNRMEMSAVIEGLKSSSADSIITVYSDSQYVIKGITEWIDGWIKKGWKNSQKKAVLNRDLWEELLTVTENKKIHWKFVKGHADNAGNIRCDEIATQFADGENIKLYNGSIGKYDLPNIIKSINS
jgi:ribonuclease HI